MQEKFLIELNKSEYDILKESMNLYLENLNEKYENESGEYFKKIIKDRMIDTNRALNKIRGDI